MYTYIGTNVFEELPCYQVFSFFVEMLTQYAELIYTRSDKKQSEDIENKGLASKIKKMSNTDLTKNRGRTPNT